MAEWKFLDGTVLHSGGKVTGDSEFADHVRRQLAEGVGVHVFALPSSRWAVDVDSDYLLDLFAREVGDLLKPRSGLPLGKVAVSTEYTRDPDDAPAGLRARFAKEREDAQLRFFDTVH